ncbi:nuclease-related domain-containing protein [Rossellomorea aquimaris]|uniref:NERD domain-containing protein n=1 Tax=Rossellomorea aquimaris TaxID=189382 RepID=A0A5D4TPY6_9BACI|nr:nuclease-related domain-containing protein [Rossellomorea aquimaris]TYS76126.1 NERD domain-containing protein [Rossellomorea aquimaris]TYS82561.1 NERD domain-containing protein [Rossellomorea aquimaris]
MVSKERPFPIKIQKLQVLLDRLLLNHAKTPIIKDNLSKSLAGYYGEKSIDYYLNLLPSEHFYILHDLRLFVNGCYFQIDTLLLTNRFAIIIEVKNIAGTVDFDTTFNQMIQLKNGVEIALPDPTIQVSMQESQFRKWLNHHHLPLIPIRTIIVISNPHTIIRSDDKDISLQVIHAASLPQKISQIENALPKSILLDKDIRKIIELINKHDTPLNPSVLEHYKVDRNEILKGIFCENCKYRPLNRVYGSWYCPLCRTKSKGAHLVALEQYYLLFGEKITGQQLKDFLVISSSALATRILNTVSIESHGIGKGRVHTLPFKQK